MKTNDSVISFGPKFHEESSLKDWSFVNEKFSEKRVCKLFVRVAKIVIHGAAFVELGPTLLSHNKMCEQNFFC